MYRKHLLAGKTMGGGGLPKSKFRFRLEEVCSLGHQPKSRRAASYEGLDRTLVDGLGATLRRSSVAHHPYSCATRAEARPRRAGGRTARFWKDCRGSLQPHLRMR